MRIHFVLFDPQTYETRQGVVVNSILQCPMNFRARCPNLMRVQHSSKVVTVWRSGCHRITSHDDDRSVFLKMKQKDGMKDAVLISPLSSGLTVWQSLKNLSLKKHVPPEFKKARVALSQQGEGKTLVSGATWCFNGRVVWEHCLYCAQEMVCNPYQGP